MLSFHLLPSSSSLLAWNFIPGIPHLHPLFTSLPSLLWLNFLLLLWCLVSGEGLLLLSFAAKTIVTFVTSMSVVEVIQGFSCHPRLPLDEKRCLRHRWCCFCFAFFSLPCFLLPWTSVPSKLDCNSKTKLRARSLYSSFLRSRKVLHFILKNKNL